MLAIAAALTQSFPLQDLWQHQTWFPSARAEAIKRAESEVPSGVTVEATVEMLPALAARDAGAVDRQREHRRAA